MRKVFLAGIAAALFGSSAQADIAVIVSAKTSVKTMSADEISRIYLGKLNAMKPVDNVKVRGQFYTKVMGKDESQIKAIWSKLIFTGKGMPPKVLASDAEVLHAVAADANTIGYVEKSAVDSSVKIVFEAN